MDQVRLILNVIWTQRFWVLSALCAIISLACWNMGTGTVDAEFMKRDAAINSVSKAVTSIKNDASHPNDNVNEGNMRQAKLQRDHVKSKWQELYDRQQAEVCQWPEDLGSVFLTGLEGKKFGDKINTELRGFYLLFINKRFDGMLKIVDAKQTSFESDSGAGGGFGGGGAAGGFGRGEAMGGFVGGGFSRRNSGTEEDPEGEDYLVLWPQQDLLRKKLNFTRKPSTLKVWVTQEDLWVYETLLDVIAKTNKARDAKRHGDTAIRVIESIKVGKEASGALRGKVFMPQADNDADGGMRDGGMRGGGFGRDEFGGGGDRGYMDSMGEGRGRGGFGSDDGSGSAGSALTTNRYLGEDGKPMAGEEGNYGTAEYRKLPIELKLFMDQRWIPHVLVECANASLPVVVKQVRINPSQSGNIEFKANQSENGKRADTHMAIVEIHGAVYIYNQPDAQQLALPGDENQEDDDDFGNDLSM